MSLTVNPSYVPVTILYLSFIMKLVFFPHFTVSMPQTKKTPPSLHHLLCKTWPDNCVGEDLIIPHLWHKREFIQFIFLSQFFFFHNKSILEVYSLHFASTACLHHIKIHLRPHVSRIQNTHDFFFFSFPFTWRSAFTYFQWDRSNNSIVFGYHSHTNVDWDKKRTSQLRI